MKYNMNIIVIRKKKPQGKDMGQKCEHDKNTKDIRIYNYIN